MKAQDVRQTGIFCNPVVKNLDMIWEADRNKSYFATQHFLLLCSQMFCNLNINWNVINKQQTVTGLQDVYTCASIREKGKGGL